MTERYTINGFDFSEHHALDERFDTLESARTRFGQLVFSGNYLGLYLTDCRTWDRLDCFEAPIVVAA